MNRLLFLFTVLISMLGFGQKTCHGVLLDSASRLPIEFANVGIIAKGYGTVTNEKGEYSFVIPDSLMDQNVRVSMLGYFSKTTSASIFQKQNSILLKQNATSLEEITVSAKKTKIKILGNETQSKSISAGFKKNSLGAELAIKLNIKAPKTQIRKFAFNINRNSLNQLPVFRLNIYNVNKKGYPNENILKQNIILEPKEMTGLVQIDLSSYNIFVDDDVFISIEWIKDLGDATGLYFSTKLLNGGTYFRQVSQDEWKKESAAGVGLYAEVAY